MGRKDPLPDKAVVPALSAASSAACLRSLGRHDVPTIAITAGETTPGLRSKYCTETVTVPDPTADLLAYEDALVSLAERSDVGTIIPVREADIYVLARNKPALSEHVGTPWPSLETLRLAQDRVELFDAAEAADVGTPKTATLDDWDDWNRNVVVKPRYTVHGAEYLDEVGTSYTHQHSTTYVPRDEDLDQSELVRKLDHVPMVQEYVPDTDEYGFFALYDRGEAVATFQHRQRRGYKYCGGPSAYRESVDDPELDAAGRRLLDELDWHGLAMVEFLRDPETGEFQLMEVNPRFWTSLPFTVQAGVDFPYYYWQQANGEPITEEPEYEVGVAGHLLRGELLHLHSILFDDYPVVERPSFAKSMVDVVASVIRHPRFDYLDFDDLGPFVQDVRNVAEQARGQTALGDPRRTNPPARDVSAASSQVKADGGSTDGSESLLQKVLP